MSNVEEKPRPCDWLTMIYMGADDDLRRFGDMLLDEVKRVGSSRQVPIVVERDPTTDEPTLRGEVLRGRFEPEKLGVRANGASVVIDFVEDCKKKFDAQKKLLILWDHGNGWQNVHSFQHVISVRDRLETVALSNALNGSGVDILGFDACLMAMIEIAYQLRRRVRFMVASENVVPADTGWPYDAILRELNARPELAPQDVARMIVSMFSGAYNGSDDPITLSALDIDAVAPVVEAISDLSRALIGAARNGQRQAILFARRYAQAFGNPDYVDLISFCIELQSRASGDVRELARVVQERAKELVIATTRGSAPSIGGAHGVSIYFPNGPVSPSYAQLDFAERSGWANFLAEVTPRIEPAKPAAPPVAPQGDARAANQKQCSHGVLTACTKCWSRPSRKHGRKTG